ncbi:MAG TPA: hypothetical protein VG605_02160, partial [Puia sp.]|nr:hypothetical protein [Puia sp.]
MRFNFSQKGRKPADTCYTHVKAGLPDTQQDLYRTLLSGSLTGTKDQQLPEDLLFLRREIRCGDRAFLARLALYLNGEKQFRELAFLLAAELAAVDGNRAETGQLVETIIRSPMDIPLWLDYYARATHKEQNPGRAIRKHLAALLNRLDEYQYGRSSRARQNALRDVLRRLRPKAADRARKTLFAGIIGDHIQVRSTWEQEWHALHQQHYDTPEQRQVTLREKWKEGISSFRIGYGPLLDNLGPMLYTGVSGKVLKLAAEYLGNAAAVKRSEINPLRLLEVYRSLRGMEQGGAGMLVEALEKAVLHTTWSRLELGRGV